MASGVPLLRRLDEPHGAAGGNLSLLLPLLGAVHHQRGGFEAPQGAIQNLESFRRFRPATQKPREDSPEVGPPRGANQEILSISQTGSSFRDPKKKKLTVGGHGFACTAHSEGHGVKKRWPGSSGVVAKDKLKANYMQKINRGTILAQRASSGAPVRKAKWSIESMTDLVGRKSHTMPKCSREQERSPPVVSNCIDDPRPSKMGSMAKAKELVGSLNWDKLKGDFKKNFFAESSRKSRDSKRKEVLDLAKLVCPHKPVIPLDRDVVEGVAAAMKQAEMRSGFQYLVELKLMHVEAGFDLTAPLLRTFDLCKKSLERGRGPVKRAAEVRIADLKIDQKKLRCQKKGWPEWPGLAFLWGSVWMLREIELRRMKSQHVKLLDKVKQVSIWIPISKCDQKGDGVKRTLACCGETPCTLTCPWSLALEVLAKSKKIRNMGDTTLIKSCHGSDVTKSGMIAAWKKSFGDMISGHSPRRSGAMFYVRAGLQIQELAFLGRWRSSIVLNYAEEALQETAVRIPMGNTTPVAYPTAPFTPVVTQPSTPMPAPATPGGQVEGPADFSTPNVCNVFNTPKNLWVVTKGRGSKTRPAHVVSRASWNLPIKSWSTSCGWLFAEKSSEFSFILGLQKDQTVCSKCKALSKCATSQRGGDGAQSSISTTEDEIKIHADVQEVLTETKSVSATIRKRPRREGGVAVK